MIWAHDPDRRHRPGPEPAAAHLDHAGRPPLGRGDRHRDGPGTLGAAPGRALHAPGRARGAERLGSSRRTPGVLWDTQARPPARRPGADARRPEQRRTRLLGATGRSPPGPGPARYPRADPLGARRAAPRPDLA